MRVACTACHHETQTVKNNKPCDWCDAPMEALIGDYMSETDGSRSTDEHSPAMLTALDTIRDGELVLLEAETLRKQGSRIRAHGYQLKYEASK